jgi:hypothetical protein
MNKMKTISDKQLRRLLQQVAPDVPSPAFMEKLMANVESEARKQARRQKWIAAWQLPAGILLLLLGPGAYVYFFVPDFFPFFARLFLHLKPDPTVMLIGCTVLLLLVADLLFRQHYFRRKNKSIG